MPRVGPRKSQRAPRGTHPGGRGGGSTQSAGVILDGQESRRERTRTIPGNSLLDRHEGIKDWRSAFVPCQVGGHVVQSPEPVPDHELAAILRDALRSGSGRISRELVL